MRILGWCLAAIGWFAGFVGVSLLASDIRAGALPSAPIPKGVALDVVIPSKNSRVEWPRNLGYRKTPLPHLGGTWLERRDDQGRTRVWISSAHLKDRPREAEVRREWQAGLEALKTSRPGTRIYTENCVREKVGILCSGESGEADKPEFLAQRMWFRGGVEKILVQVRSSVSREHAVARLGEFALVSRSGARSADGKGAR